MCNFISFKIEKSPEGLKVITAKDLAAKGEIIMADGGADDELVY